MNRTGGAHTGSAFDLGAAAAYGSTPRRECLLCLLPSWPIHQVLDLAPANWPVTAERPEVQTKLSANIYRAATLTETPAAHA
jgi:hypothetical protein